MDRGAFTSEEVEKLENKIGINYFIAIFAEEQIETEEQFDALYKKSRGCVMDENWCFFYTGKKEEKKETGNMYKVSVQGIKMLAKKFDIELK